MIIGGGTLLAGKRGERCSLDVPAHGMRNEIRIDETAVEESTSNWRRN
jgi:hypothetical protein